MKRAGFTLLELMVTLGLFSAIMGVLMGVFFQFGDQKKRFESTTMIRQESRLLEHLLRQDLQAAINLREFTSPNEKGEPENPSGLIGINERTGNLDSDRLHLHVNRPVRFFRGLPINRDPEVHEVSYFLEADEGGKQQFMRREEFYVDADMTDGEEEIKHPLSGHVIAFDVKYFLANRAEPLEEWGTDAIKREFGGAVGIPAAVQVTLRLRNTDGEELESGFQINLQPEMGGGILWK